MDAQRAVDGGADGARRKEPAAVRRCEAAVASDRYTGGSIKVKKGVA